MSMESAVPFFRAGGTLEPGAQSYITRRADEQLFQALVSGEYVYLLDSRQKGKSSLIARSIMKLREVGVLPAKLDLQRIGANVTPEQWYGGLAVGAGQELGMQAEVIRYWQERQSVGPLSRFVGVLQEVVLPKTDKPVVIFVDEVDFVRALNFSTDEFFAAIRESFNRRSSDETFKRLTFCLAGVATPGQLIRNPDISPFNIGVRIELTDFTLDETRSYAKSLEADGRDGEALVERVHHWVGGHPYLTQLLCSRVARDPEVTSRAALDALVRETLFSPEARQREPNLADVERRLLDPDVPGMAPDEKRVQVLELYGRMLKSDQIDATEQNPVVATLRLSGVGIEETGCLRVRNRVYRTVFDNAWRVQNLPEAEVRRQSAATRRATLRTAAVAAVVVLAVAATAAGFFKVSKDRESALAELAKRSEELKQQNYVGLMASIRLAMSENRWTMVSKLIDQSKNDPLRGWEWGFVARSVNRQVAEGKAPPLRNQFEQDPDGSLSLITRDSIYTVTPAGLRLRRKFIGPNVLPQYRKGDLRLGVDAETGRYVLRESESDKVVMRSDLIVLSFDPKARTIVVGRGDGVLEKRDFQGKTLQVLGPYDRNKAASSKLKNGDEITLLRDGTLTRTDASGKLVAATKIDPPPSGGDQTLRTSWDGSLLTHVDWGVPRRIDVRRVSDLKVVATLDAPPTIGGVRAFSLDNRSLLVSDRGSVTRYDLKTGKALSNYYGLKTEVFRMEILPDGRHFACIDRSGVVRVWPLVLTPLIQDVAKVSDPPTDLLRCDDPDVLLYPTAAGAFESRNLLTGRVARVANPAGTRVTEPLTVIANRRVFVGTASGSVDRYAVDGLVKEKSVRVFDKAVFGVGVLMGGRRLLATANLGKGEPHTSAEYAIIDPETMEVLHRFGPEWPLPGVNYVGLFTSDGPIFGLAANRWFKGQMMASPGEIRLVSAETGKLLRKMSFQSQVTKAALSSDGSKLIVSLFNGLVQVSSRIEVYDTATGERAGSLELPPNVVVMNFYRKRDLLVADLADNNLAVWDLSKGPQCRSIAPGQRIAQYDVSPDLDRVVTALTDGNVMIWDAKTGADLYTLRTYTPDGVRPLGPVTNLATFSSDGSRLLTYSGDGIIRSFGSMPWKGQPSAERKNGP